MGQVLGREGVRPVATTDARVASLGHELGNDVGVEVAACQRQTRDALDPTELRGEHVVGGQIAGDERSRRQRLEEPGAGALGAPDAGRIVEAGEVADRHRRLRQHHRRHLPVEVDVVDGAGGQRVVVVPAVVLVSPRLDESVLGRVAAPDREDVEPWLGPERRGEHVDGLRHDLHRNSRRLLERADAFLERAEHGVEVLEDPGVALRPAPGVVGPHLDEDEHLGRRALEPVGLGHVELVEIGGVMGNHEQQVGRPEGRDLGANGRPPRKPADQVEPLALAGQHLLGVGRRVGHAECGRAEGLGEQVGQGEAVRVPRPVADVAEGDYCSGREGHHRDRRAQREGPVTKGTGTP